MLKYKSALFPACAILLLISLGEARAASHSVTYVSGKGSDSSDCSSPTTPCRSFQHAVGQTVAGGEVKALDPADYFPVIINKAISLTGVNGAGIVANGGTGIAVSPPSGVVNVNLANLLIRNQNAGSPHSVGINGEFSGSLAVKHCTVDGFETGILGSGASVLIADTFVTGNNAGTGIDLGFSVDTLEHVVVTSNSFGVRLGLPPHSGNSRVIADSMVTAVDTIADDNGTGFDVGAGTALFLARSTVSGNSVGININKGGGPFPSGVVESFGDNHIRGNFTDVKGGTLTNVGAQ